MIQRRVRREYDHEHMQIGHVADPLKRHLGSPLLAAESLSFIVTWALRFRALYPLQYL